MSMGDHTLDEIVKLACSRLDGLDARMTALRRGGPTWRILYSEYVDLYNEVYNNNFDSLRRRFQSV